MQANLNPRQHTCDNLTLDTKFIKPTLLFNQGHALAQLIEALRYKMEGREFDS
jgi:hypothetical protein